MMHEEEEGLQRIHDARAFRHLWTYTKGLRHLFYGAAFLTVFSSSSHVLAAKFLGILVDQGIKAASHERTLQAALWIIACEIVAMASSFAGRKILAMASLQAMLNVRRALFKHLQELPMSFIDKQPKGRIVTRMAHDVEAMESFFSETLVRLMSALITMTVVMAGMILLDHRLGLMVLAMMIPTVVLTLVIRGPVRHWNREFAKRNASINSRLSEFLNGIPLIRSLGLEPWSQEQLDQRIDHHLISAMKINRLNGWSRPLIMYFTQLPNAALLGLGAVWVTKGLVPLSHFISFLRLAERFINPMNVISQELHVVQTALAHTERVASFLAERTEEAVLGTGTVKPAQRLRGDIEFKNLTMTYESGKPALQTVTFKIATGEKIGLVGRTGSGKTTTISLLTRLYEFQEGDILLDGRPIRDYDRDWLRAQFSVVTQDSILFYGTLKENLLAGGTDPGNEHLLAACRESGFYDLWQSSGLDLDSQILDNGENLSAGERQMLAITRALLLNPSILVLDEATANIDAKNERLVHEAVHRLMKGRTCLLVAHRLETLKDCDRILVFKHGNLVESGSRTELLKTGGYFSELVAKSAHEGEPVEELSHS